MFFTLYTHPIMSETAAVKRASSGEFMLRPVFSPSMAHLKKKGTETFKTLEPTNKPNAIVTLFLICASFCKTKKFNNKNGNK